MKILLVGSGGREHALAWKLKQSPRCTALYCAPGNPGTAALGMNVDIKATDIEGLLRFAKQQDIGLTIVGPEEPLTLGIVDIFSKAGLRCFGPSKAAAELEGSKVAMKEFLRRHRIPTAVFKIFDDPQLAIAHVHEVNGPCVVKCDGLAAGKGVTVAKDPAEAADAIDRIMRQQVFGKAAGRRVVIEECLRGQEISVFALCDGRNAVLLDYAQDHKQVFDGDRGPNTGGMGAFTPAPGLVSKADEDAIVERILVPTLSGLVREERPYTGVLYLGLMLTAQGPKVIEYNVRFGDPECQALLLRLDSDLVELCEAALDRQLDRKSVRWDPRTAICVTLAAPGYPGTYAKDLPITGLDAVDTDAATVFHAGTALARDGRLVSAGGRVLSVCALGADLEEARSKAYSACDQIRFGDGAPLLRRDIGRRSGTPA